MWACTVLKTLLTATLVPTAMATPALPACTLTAPPMAMAVIDARSLADTVTPEAVPSAAPRVRRTELSTSALTTVLMSLIATDTPTDAPAPTPPADTATASAPATATMLPVFSAFTRTPPSSSDPAFVSTLRSVASTEPPMVLPLPAPAPAPAKPCPTATAAATPIDADTMRESLMASTATPWAEAIWVRRLASFSDEPSMLARVWFLTVLSVADTPAAMPAPLPGETATPSPPATAST